MKPHQIIHKELRKAVDSVGGRFLLALSGGADSVSLFHALRECDIPFDAVNCNFNLRGEESRRDSQFVATLCERYDVLLFCEEYDVKARRRATGESLEMACRSLRYESFFRLLESGGYSRLLTAHHLDDNLETMLLNLFRGTGIRGLCGMKRDDGRIMRPLITIPHDIILSYLDEIGAEYVVDSTNLTSDFRRNFIRNSLLPELSERWPGIRKALARTQDNLQSEMRMIEDALQAHSPAEELLFSSEQLSAITSLRPVILEAIRPYGGNGVQATEIERAVQMGNFPRMWQFDNHKLILDRDGISLRSLKDNLIKNHPFAFEKIVLDKEKIRAIKADRSNTSLWLPAEIGEIRFVHPAAGMRIESLGMSGSQLVSDVLKDAGVPSYRRAEIWIAVDSEDRLLWIEGIKRSRHALLRLQPGEEAVCIHRK